jgi:hypothetical protein
MPQRSLKAASHDTKSNTPLSQGGNTVIIILLVLILLVVGAMFAWLLFSRNRAEAPATTTPPPAASNAADQPADSADVKSLVSYSLPSGYKETVCPDGDQGVVLSRNGDAAKACDATAPAPGIRIMIDPRSAKDCNDLQNVQAVSKHICKSEFIDGHKTLEAETVYNDQSEFGTETKLKAYYFDAGDSVVKVYYLVSPPEAGNDLDAALRQVAQSLKAV